MPLIAAEVSTASVLLTPFRTQNVPPPMASHILPIPYQNGTQTFYDTHTLPLSPIHVSFFPHKDIMLLLWESGYHEIIDLQTRLGPGKEKVMDPVTKYFVPEDVNGSKVYKQAVPYSQGADFVSFALLQASNDRDRVTLVTVSSDDTALPKLDIDMPGCNGRLLYGTAHVVWQSSSGEVHSSKRVLLVLATTADLCAQLKQHLEKRRFPVNSANFVLRRNMFLFLCLQLTGKALNDRYILVFRRQGSFTQPLGHKPGYSLRM